MSHARAQLVRIWDSRLRCWGCIYFDTVLQTNHSSSLTVLIDRATGVPCSVIFVNENENENYQKRKNNDSVNEN